MKTELLLAIMLLTNVMLFVVQESLVPLAVEEGVLSPSFYDFQTGALAEYGNGTYILNDDVGSQLPDGQTEITSGGDSGFTDTFSTVKTWLVSNIPFAKTILGVITSVPDILKLANFPDYVTFAISSLWYALALFLIVNLLFLR